MLLIKWPLALLIAAIVGTTQSRKATVDWLRPKETDSFGPGDKIIGAWNAEQTVLSPSFRLCISSSNDTERARQESSKDPEDSNECSSAIWPPVTQNAGSYSISLVSPKVQSRDKYILQMEDEYGFKYESPTFSLIPSISLAATEGDLSVTDSPQAPLGSRPAEGNTTQSSGKIDPTIGLVPVVPRPLSDDPISLTTNRSSPGSPFHTLSAAGSVTPSTTAPVPNVLVARRAVATAAYTIPLAVFAAILIIAGGLAIRQRYKLRQERRSNVQKLSISRDSSRNSKPVGDIEHALNSLDKEEAAHPVLAPVPLFMPVEAYITPKRSTRESLPVPHHTAHPAPSPTKLPRPPSSRSILSSSYHLPPIVPSSAGFFDGHDGVTNSVIAAYFEPSPPVSPSQLPSVPKRLHLRDRATTRRNYVNDNLPHPPH